MTSHFSLAAFKILSLAFNSLTGDFPGGPVVKTLRFHCRGVGAIPGQGTKIPHAARHSQKKKKLSFFFLNLFIYLLMAVLRLREGFLQLRQAGATLHRGARASHYRGLSCCGAQAPHAQAQ